MPRNSTSLTSTLHALCAAAIAPSLSDRELVARFVQQHDQEAFSALVRRHALVVWSVCRRVLGQHADIEDAVQATFVLLSRKAAGLKNPELVGAWLHAVARKVALKARNRQSRDRVVPLDQDVPHTQDPLDVLSGREVLAILDEELARLPEEYRAVLLLCCIEGKSREEAAQRLGWSQGSVKGRLERGRDLLSRRLSRRGLTLSAALGASLVWQTTTAYAAIPAVAYVLDSATPQAVALANAVAGSLGTGIWIKWGLVGALLLTGTGVGVGIWGHSTSEPSPRSQQVRVEKPNAQPQHSAEQPPPNAEQAEKIVVRTETLVGTVVKVEAASVVLQPQRSGNDDARNENQLRLEPRELRLDEQTVIDWDGQPASLADLRKGLRITVTAREIANHWTAERIEVHGARRDRGKPEGPEKPFERKNKD